MEENKNTKSLEPSVDELQMKLMNRTQQLEEVINAYNSLLVQTKALIQTNEILINKIISDAQKG